MRSPVRVLLIVFALVALSPLALCLGLAGWVGDGGGLGPLAAVVPALGPGGAGASSPAAGATEAATSSEAARAVSWALAQLGTPYRWGGEGDGGFDCSGLVQAAFAAAGVHLPRVAQDQFDAGPHLPAGATLRPGDLVFFGASSTQVDHVGIVVATNEMVDAPHTGAVVRVEPIFAHGYVGATRPAP
jgi:cell wall-associated NlpC family hydrolase